MNKDQIKGRVEEAKGTLKEKAGQLTGNPDLEDRGTVEKVSGNVRKTFGDVKENIKDQWQKP